MHRRQIGFLSPDITGEGVRVSIAYEGDEPGHLVDIRAAVVEGGWLFERSLVPRAYGSGEAVPGAMRMGELSAWSIVDKDGCWEGASVEQIEAGLAVVQSGRTNPTYREVRTAKGRMKPAAIRTMIEQFLTGPEGGDMFRGWGDQFTAWKMDAGPFDARGRKREVIKGDGPGDPDTLVLDRRGYRDDRARFQTEPEPFVRVPLVDVLRWVMSSSDGDPEPGFCKDP